MRNEYKALGGVAAALGLITHTVGGPFDEIKAVPVYYEHGAHIEHGQPQPPNLWRTVTANVGSMSYVLHVEAALPFLLGGETPLTRS